MKLSSALSKSVDQIKMYKVLYNMSSTDIGRKAIEFIDEDHITHESILDALLKAIDINEMWNVGVSAYFSGVNINPKWLQTDVNYHLVKNNINHSVQDSVMNMFNELGYPEIDSEEKAHEALISISAHLSSNVFMGNNQFITHKTAKLLLVVLVSSDMDEVDTIDYLTLFRDRDWQTISDVLRLRIIDTKCYNPILYKALKELEQELNKD